MKNQIKKEYQKNRLEFTNFLSRFKTVGELLNTWQINRYFTKGQKAKTWTFEELRTAVMARYDKARDKDLAKSLARYDAIKNSGTLQSISISIEWTKSVTWGANPRGTASVYYVDRDGATRYATITTGSVTGCGFDKLSTVVANLLNPIGPLSNILYTYKELHGPDIRNSEVFAYGAGYDVLPHFEGGVGVECFETIFKKIGFDFKRVASGKMFDTFTITKTV